MRLPYLEGLRGCMAIWVVLIHAVGFTPYAFDNIFSNGQLPVAVFVLLSGFVTHILLEKKEKYGQYLKRRALRLFPIYIITFLISLFMLDLTNQVLKDLFVQNDRNLMRIDLLEKALSSNIVLNTISHLTLTHGLFPDSIFPFSFTIMGQSWSLTLEWQFYTIIPFIFLLVQKPINTFKLSMSLSILLILIVYSRIYMPQSSFLPNMLYLFMIGFFSLPLYKKYVDKGSNGLFIFIGAVAVLVLFVQYQLIVVMLIWAVVLWMQKNKPIHGERLFNNSWVQYIGKISYSIYCVHMIVLVLIIYLTEKIQLTDELFYSLIVLLGGTVISIAVSMFTYKYIEEPFIKLGKRKASKSQESI